MRINRQFRYYFGSICAVVLFLLSAPSIAQASFWGDAISRASALFGGLSVQEVDNRSLLAAPAAVSLPSAISDVSSVHSFTNQITSIIANPRGGALATTGGSATDPLLADIVAKRKAKMLELAKTDPNGFLASVMPEVTRKILPQSLQGNIEKETTLTGTLEVWHSDDFEHPENSRFFYFLNVSGSSGGISKQSTATTRIELYPTEPFSAVSGAKVRVKGYRIENVMVSRVGKANMQKAGETPPLGSVGDQKTLVLLLQYTDSETPPFTKEQASDLVFNGQFQKFYEEQSYGKVSFSGDVYGWFTLDRPGKDICYDGGGKESNVSDPEISAIIRDNSIDLSRYSRIVFLHNHPQIGGGCSTVGRAEYAVNGRTYLLSQVQIGGLSYYAQKTHQYFSWLDEALSHELGHSLGLWHAQFLNCGRETLYGDCKIIDSGNPFDMMGARGFSTHFNAFYKELLGWIESGKSITIESPGQYTLSPLEKNEGVLLAKINNPLTNTPYLALEYRRAIGFDRALNSREIASNTEGVLVNKIDVPNTFFNISDDVRITSLLDMEPTNDIYRTTLNSDALFTDPETGIVLGPVTQVTSSSISFRVQIDPPKCIQRNPYFSLSSYIPERIIGASTIPISFSLVNKDSPTCQPSVFTLAISDIPLGWNYKFNLDNGLYSIAPKEMSQPSLTFFPPQTANGVFNITVNIYRDGSVVANRVLSLSVMLPPKITKLVPDKGKVGDAILLEQENLPRQGAVYIKFSNQFKHSRTYAIFLILP